VVVVAAVEEEAFTSLEEGCPVADDNEALLKGFPEGFHSNEIQRISTQFSTRTNIPDPGSPTRVRCLLGIHSRMSSYDTYAEWVWGSCSPQCLFR
jgi:hypothetical protein